MLLNYWETNSMKRLIIIDYCKYIFNYNILKHTAF